MRRYKSFIVVMACLSAVALMGCEDDKAAPAGNELDALATVNESPTVSAEQAPSGMACTDAVETCPLGERCEEGVCIADESAEMGSPRGGMQSTGMGLNLPSSADDGPSDARAGTQSPQENPSSLPERDHQQKRIFVAILQHQRPTRTCD